MRSCVFLPFISAPLGRPVEGRRLHKVRPARRGRAGDPRAERHHTEGLVRADHRQVRQQSQQQQQGDTAVGRLSRTTGHAALRRADPPSDRPLQVHSTVATIQVPTRLYSLYPRIFTIFLTLLSSLSFSFSSSPLYSRISLNISVGECCAKRFVAIVNRSADVLDTLKHGRARTKHARLIGRIHRFSAFVSFTSVSLSIGLSDNSSAVLIEYSLMSYLSVYPMNLSLPIRLSIQFCLLSYFSV